MQFLKRLFWKKKPKPVYKTRVVEGPDKRGVFVVETLKDGVPCNRVRVHSMSRTLAYWAK